MADERESPDCSEGAPRYFRPVCAKGPLGFLGGPSGYTETDSPDGGPVIVDGTIAWTVEWHHRRLTRKGGENG